eukprot:7570868-Lingulodinium_polyedra.AAC.1
MAQCQPPVKEDQHSERVPRSPVLHAVQPVHPPTKGQLGALVGEGWSIPQEGKDVLRVLRVGKPGSLAALPGDAGQEGEEQCIPPNASHLQ